MSKTSKKEPFEPVTFYSDAYLSGSIQLGKDRLEIKHGRITVTTPDQLLKIEDMYGFTRSASC